MSPFSLMWRTPDELALQSVKVEGDTRFLPPVALSIRRLCLDPDFPTCH